MTNRKFFAILVLMLLFFAAVFSTGCGGGGNDRDLSNTPQETPEEKPIDGDSYIVTFDSQGGSYVEDQEVEAGKTAEIPDEPEKDDNSFMGWYTAEGFSFRFDFNTPISRDITLYAKWWDINDTTDTDGDGLIDSLERTYGTDPNNVDTDDDGLSDYDELNFLEYNPLVKDTDDNGVEDGDEDADGDGLTNIEEAVLYGTDMIVADTDHDGLTDYEEVKTYETDPLKADTDEDGVDDATEVAIGSNPLEAEENFDTTLSSNLTAENPKAIDIAVKMNSAANAAGTLRVAPADYSDNPLITSGIPGYLTAYNINADGDFNSAEIKFTLGSDVWVESDDFKPTIYYLNEETGILEEVPGQTCENGVITASVNHFSIYVLINQVVYNGVWSTEIRLPSSGVSIDVVFVIDCSGSMRTNDPQKLALSLPQQFIDKLRDDSDRAAAVKFSSSATVVSGLTNDKEALKSAIAGITYYGDTNGRDGLHSGLVILNTSEAAHKFVIFLTDGIDNEYSPYSYPNLIAEAKDKGILVYTIGMGSAKEDILKQIASETGGAYYKATAGASIADMVSLNDIFDEIYQEAIDMATDSNNDNISDYFTKLLNDGQLVISNGSSILVGVTDMFGNSDDWDGDGLKNGDEITIVSEDLGEKIRVTAYMKSNPILWDTDFDGYSDGEEVNNMHTSPLKYTLGSADMNWLASDSNFPREYINASMPDDSLSFKVNAFMFAGDVKKQAIKAFVDYFQKYSTSEEVLSRDALASARLELCKDLHDGIVLISDVIKAAKTITSIGEDIGSGVYDADENARKVFRGTRERLDKLLEAKYRDVNTINSASRAALFARSAQKAETDLLVSLVDNAANSSKEAIAEGLDWSNTDDFINNGTSLVSADIVVRTANAILTLGKTVADVKNTFNNGITLPCLWEWMSSSPKDITFNVGDKIQLVVYALDIVENYADIAVTYGQIAANCYEYQKYLSLLKRVANDDRLSSYVRAGAAEVADMFDNNGNPDWEEFDRKLRAAKVKAVTLATLKNIVNIGVDVAEKKFPVLILADVAYNIFMATSGVKEGYETLIATQVYYSITDASRTLFAQAVNVVNGYLESKIEGDSATKYAVQLAQSRIVGVDNVKKYLLNGKLTSWLIGLVVNKTPEAIRTEYENAIQKVYDIADKCKLELSDKLPK